MGDGGSGDKSDDDFYKPLYSNTLSVVIPAQAGIQGRLRRCPWPWIPACAGMTVDGLVTRCLHPLDVIPAQAGMTAVVGKYRSDCR